MTYVAMRISALWYERSVYDCELHGILYRKHTEEKNRKCKFPSRVLNYGLVLFYNNRSKVTCTTISDKMITCNFKLHLYSYIVQFSNGLGEIKCSAFWFINVDIFLNYNLWFWNEANRGFFLLFIKILCGSIYLLKSEFLRSRKLVATAKSRAVVCVIFLPRSLEKAHLF